MYVFHHAGAVDVDVVGADAGIVGADDPHVQQAHHQLCHSHNKKSFLFLTYQ